MNYLTFRTLREANLARLPQFKNARGEPAHSQPNGSDWSPGEWMNAILGELGEAANIVKKLKRGDFGPAGSEDNVAACAMLAKEFADVVTYLDITASQFGIDLGQATEDKFNEVSGRVGSTVRIEHDYVRTNADENWGEIVRYDVGSTALCELRGPHAGGYHGVHCMGGSVFVTDFRGASPEDIKTWNECAKYRTK